MKWLKRLVIAVSIVLALLIGLIVSLPFLIDPNDFKPYIVRAAAEQGYRLSMDGPIRWKFYPELGLHLEDVTASTLEADPGQDLLQVSSLTGAVAVKPLLSRQVNIKSIALNGAHLHLAVDAQGRDNWLPPQSPDAAPATSATTEQPATAPQPFKIAVESFEFRDVSLRYTDAQNQQNIAVDDINISLSQVALDGSGFPVTLGLTLTHSDLPAPLTVDFSAQLHANLQNENQQSFGLQNAKLAVTLNGKNQTTLATQFNVAVQHQPEAAEFVTATGHIALQPVNVIKVLNALNQPLPEFSNSRALTSVDLTTDFQIAATENNLSLSLQKMLLQLDVTTLQSELAVTLPLGENTSALPAIQLQATLDNINVDDYLPPPSTVEAAPVAGGSTDTPLPLALLRAFNATIGIDIQQLQIQQAQLQNTQLQVEGKNGLWQVNKLNTQTYGGSLQATAAADARKNTLLSTLNAQLQSIDLHSLLSEQAGFADLQGVLSGTLRADIAAATVNGILPGTTANLNFTSDKLVVNGFNAEQYYCTAVTQIQKSPALGKTWPKATEVLNVGGQVQLQNQRAELQNITARMGGMTVRATGSFDLNDQRFGLRMPMKFETVPRTATSTESSDTDTVKTSVNGCAIESNFLIDRELDIFHCNGTLPNIEFGRQCGIDNSALGDLLKEALRYNAKREIEKSGANEKVDEKKLEIRNKAKDSLNKLLGDDSQPSDETPNEATEDKDDKSSKEKLRDLLRR